MNCPRCTVPAKENSPYRDGAAGLLRHAELCREAHKSGIEIERCEGCGGVWLDPGELEKIQRWAREREGASRARSIDDAVQRAYARAREPEREPVICPSCGDDMFEREWGFGSMVMVDVCIGCRGVWLDVDELESLVAYFAFPFS